MKEKMSEDPQVREIRLLQELIAYFETGRRMIPPSHSDTYAEALASVSDRKIREMEHEAQYG